MNNKKLTEKDKKKLMICGVIVVVLAVLIVMGLGAR